MDFEKLPWRDGVAAVLAIVLLKMLWDAVYRKIPAGFRGVRLLLKKQTELAMERHAEHMAKQNSLEDAIKELKFHKCKEQQKRRVAAEKQKKRPAK